MNETKEAASRWSMKLWDIFCFSSLLGIWPRFVEPNLLTTTHISIAVEGLSSDLEDLRIVQFSDLHLNTHVSDYFLNKIIRKVHALNPDILVFTGDFLCYSKLPQTERLLKFFNSFHTKHGCYAILGNHDYAKSVSINEKGEYDIVTPVANLVAKGLRMVAVKTKLKGVITERAKQVEPHQALLKLLEKTPFHLLHNSSVTVSIGTSGINLAGLGEYTIGKTVVEQAFAAINPLYPTIALLHNPDAVPFLKETPAQLILCGHTHGGQINLPFLWKRFTLMEIPQYKKGLISVDDKHLYVSRGVGSVFPFRFGSIPEIVSITLKSSHACK